MADTPAPQPSSSQPGPSPSDQAPKPLEQRPLREVLDGLRHLALGDIAKIIGFLLAIGAAGFSVGTYLAQHRIELAQVQSQRDIAKCESAQARIEGELGETKKEIGLLKEANEQKICTALTLKQKQATVRRLKSTLVQIREELKEMTVDADRQDAGGYLLGDVHFFGLEGIDPSVFDDDDQTMALVREIVDFIAAANNVLKDLRTDRQLPFSANDHWQNNRYANAKYEEIKAAIVNDIVRLLQHLDDRYNGAGPRDGGT